MKLLPALLPAVLLALLLAACDGDEDGAATATVPATNPVTLAPTTTPAATPETGFEGAQDPVDGTIGAFEGTTPELVDVRAAEHDGFDRVTLEFSAEGSDYRVEYVTNPIQCGSGSPADLQAAAYLEVSLTPAAAHDDAGKATFETQELIPGLRSILEVQQTCDFEGVVTWVVGLPAQLDFRATPLVDTPRLAVDVAHP